MQLRSCSGLKKSRGPWCCPYVPSYYTEQWKKETTLKDFLCSRTCRAEQTPVCSFLWIRAPRMIYNRLCVSQTVYFIQLRVFHVRAQWIRGTLACLWWFHVARKPAHCDSETTDITFILGQDEKRWFLFCILLNIASLVGTYFPLGCSSYPYLLSCCELDERIDTTLVSVPYSK